MGMILVGDIGGTRSRLALADAQGRLHDIGVFDNDAHSDFDNLLAAYLRNPAMRPAGACLAVAGPIADDGRHAKLTNRDWRIDLARLEQRFGLSHTRLVNDFAAAAMGVTVDTDDDPMTLQAGRPVSDALRLVIGAGTGLGVASLIAAAQGWRVLPGEGGHIGFAPQDETQDGLCHWLREQHGRVIIEHVVSGNGLAAIHDYLHGRRLSPADVAQHAQQGDVQALASFDLFASIYGAVAGDYALARMARGGVFLAGGIAAANLDLMQRGPFLKAFNEKGVHSGLAACMPVAIVTEPLLGLYGAALLAK
ncbi:MAG: glucokinase [Rhodocyclaceae bacterium]|nr:glucokinase [Rhodocyclaceae bacterium]